MKSAPFEPGSEPSRSLAPLLLTALFAFPALLLTAAGCTLFQNAALVQSGDAIPASVDCQGCHQEQYAEWNASRHAQAFVDEEFRMETADYRIEECLGCHVPESIFTSGAPRARRVRLEEGVNCVACHLEQGRLQGPVETTGLVKPHAMTEGNDFYRSSELCGTCHEKSFAQWQSASMEEKKSCQECHMKPVTRTTTQAEGGIGALFVALEEPVKQRKHTFDVHAVEGLDDALQLELLLRDDHVLARISNRLPHGVPTGGFGIRRVRLEVDVVDGAGGEHRHSHVFRSQGSSALAALSVREVRFAAEGPATASGRVVKVFPAGQRAPLVLAEAQAARESGR